VVVKTGVVVASGGIDSTVLIYQLHKKGKLGGVFFMDYGQASRKVQLKYLKHHQNRLGFELIHQRVQFPGYMLGSGAIISGKVKTAQKDAYESLSLSGVKLSKWMDEVWDYIPARNTMFILYALAWARWKEYKVVYTGFQFDEPEWKMFHKQMDYSSPGFDTTPGYVDAFNYFLSQGAMDGEMRVESPFLTDQLDKAAIVKLGRRLKVDLDKTWSCEFYPECGACRGCLVRKKVLTSQGETVR
jgi:7-cyano-7-deazaguanine synthase